MRYLFDNIILNANISAVGGNLNYPSSNIQNVFLHKKFKTLSGSAVITVVWDDDQSADCLFYAYHDLSALTAVYKNSGGGTIATITPSSIADVGVEYFAKLSTIRSIEISVTCTYIGGIATGVYYQMPDPLADFNRPLVDNSFVRQSPSGQVLSNYEEPLKAPEWTFQAQPVAIANEIRESYILLGKGTPFYADFFENNRDYYAPLYCFFVSEPGDQKSGRRIDYSIELREAR